jgi:invasion protein IalB
MDVTTQVGLPFALLVCALTPLPAAAQQSTTATYEDWVVRCSTQGTPPQKHCDMEQLTQMQGQTSPTSRLVVTYVKGQPLKLTAQLPVNILLATSLKIQMSDNDPGVSAPFQRCVPAGCFSTLDIKDDLVRKFREAKTPGKMSFKDAAGRDVALPVSFKGFGQAFDMLTKQ